MNIKRKMPKAFTLAEMMLVFLLIGIIAAITISSEKDKFSFALKYEYYAAYNNLKIGLNEILLDKTSYTQTVPRFMYQDVLNKYSDWSHADNSYESCYTQGHGSGMLKKSTPGQCDPQIALVNSTYSAYVNAINTSNAGSASNGMPDSQKLPIIPSMVNINEAGTSFINNRETYNYAANGNWISTTEATGVLPDNAVTFCNKLTGLINTTGTVNCNAATSPTGPFIPANSNFRATNGMYFFNFGSAHSNPGGFPPEKQIYTVQIDVDGDRGKAIKGKDVFEFQIDRTGRIYPSKGTSTDPADNKKIVTANVRKGTTILRSGVTFRQAACESGYLDPTKEPTYCSGYTLHPSCNETPNICEFIVNKP